MITVAASLFLTLAVQEPTLTAKVTVDSLKKDVVKGTVTVNLPEGWHAYQNPPKSEWENPLTVKSKTKGFTFSKLSYPAGKAMSSFGSETLVYEGEVKIPFEAKIAKTVKAKKGAYTFNFEISYQICNESTCKPPASLDASVVVKVSK